MNSSGKHRLARSGRERTLSKGDRQGQATPTIVRRPTARLLIGAALTLLAGGALAQDASNRPTPSGLPVPRYVTLKFGEVNARAGPGDDHRLLWVYKARGLPVQVVAETRDWRRVCDPKGGLAWVHSRTIDGRRNVLGLTPPAPIRSKARDDGRIVAYLRPLAPAALDRCKDGWCRIKVEKVKGWVTQRSVWGATEAPQCR
ncbi:MAG TPA: SH3 domain-containing protein [Caulobacteraceae bacterium]|nr:SH3 domain-containing protein [Caulobacteraceae bacterium]